MEEEEGIVELCRVQLEQPSYRGHPDGNLAPLQSLDAFLVGGGAVEEKEEDAVRQVAVPDGLRLRVVIHDIYTTIVQEICQGLKIGLDTDPQSMIS